jgi:hypothetical protein
LVIDFLLKDVGQGDPFAQLKNYDLSIAMEGENPLLSSEQENKHRNNVT